MKFTNSIFENNANSAVRAVALQDAMHDRLSIILVLFIGEANLLLDYSDTHDLVAVINKLLEEPL